MSPMLRATGALILVVLLPACGAAGPAARPCALPAGDPLCPLNDAFRDAYSDRRAAMLATSGPVLLQVRDRILLLLRGGERLEGSVTNARYHALKSVAHVPFAVHLLLSPVEGRIDEDLARKLATYRLLVQRAAGMLDGRFADTAQRERQRRILGGSLALLARVLDERRASAATVRDFVRAQRRDVLDNVRDAARKQIATMHAQMTAWAVRMTPEERSRLRAVVGMSHMARRGNAALQYLEVWLGEPYPGRAADERVAEGERIVVAEGIFDEERSLALLGTHLVDRAAAAVFFEDPLRLDRDLLSDGAEESIRDAGARARPRGRASLSDWNVALQRGSHRCGSPR